MDIYSEFMALLEAAIKREGNAVNLAAAIGMTSNQLTRWRSRSRAPRLSNIQPVLDYWGARLVWPGSQEPDSDAGAAPSKTYASKLADLESIIAKLQAELVVTRSERDMAQGEVRALERQLARLTPSPEERNESSSDSTYDTHGEAVRAI